MADVYQDHVWITTHYRKFFHLHGDDPHEICLEDIAHATSNLCRYTGHVREFYSVAEHMVLVSKIVKVLGGKLMDQQTGLFHDATEAYLSDIAAPFKAQLTGYKELEHKIWKRIAAKFELPIFLNGLIKKADWLALFIEARVLMTSDLSTWIGYKEHKVEVDELSANPELMIWCHAPKVARAHWLHQFKVLTSQPKGPMA